MKWILLLSATCIYAQDPAIQKLIREIESLKTQTGKLAERVKQLEEEARLAKSLKVNTLELTEFRGRWLTMPETEATFSVSDIGQGFKPLLTQYGTLLVALKQIEPIGDGQKITFSVANLTAMRLNDTKLEVAWNIAASAKNQDWFKSLKNQTFSLNNSLGPGIWNAVSVILPNTEGKETGYLSLMIEPTGAGAK